MNRYRVLLPLQVDTREGGTFLQGDEFETDLSEDDESTNIASGLLEIVPQRFKVVGEQRVHETEPGEEFEAAMPVGQQRLLIEGGHIEKIEPPPPPPKKKKTRAKKE